METPSIEPRPEIRGPLISLLMQLHIDTGVGHVELEDTDDLWPTLSDLVLLFLLYVRETEEKTGGPLPATLDALAKMARMFVEYVAETENTYGGDFREFLQEQALEAFGGDGGPAPGAS